MKSKNKAAARIACVLALLLALLPCTAHARSAQPDEQKVRAAVERGFVRAGASNELLGAIKIADPAAYRAMIDKTTKMMMEHLAQGKDFDQEYIVKVVNRMNAEGGKIIGKYEGRGSDGATLAYVASTVKVMRKLNSRSGTACVSFADGRHDALADLMAARVEFQEMQHHLAEVVRSYRAERKIPTVDEIQSALEAADRYLIKKYGLRQVVKMADADLRTLSAADKHLFCEIAADRLQYLADRREVGALRRISVGGYR